MRGKAAYLGKHLPYVDMVSRFALEKTYFAIIDKNKIKRKERLTSGFQSLTFEIANRIVFIFTSENVVGKL